MRLVTAVLVVLVLTPATATAGDIPLLGAETPRGRTVVQPLPAQRPAPITVDGRTSDWRGESPRLAGTLVTSAGEAIYTDHLFDAHGADDGRDAQRLGLLQQLHGVMPGLYRLDAIAQNDPAGQVGAPTPEQAQIFKEHGDLGLQDKADLVELRATASASDLFLLARTTTMASSADTAVLVILDTTPGNANRAVGFGSALTSATAEQAVLLAGDRGWIRDLASGVTTPLPAGSVATNPTGYDNAIEARISRAGLPAKVGIGAATGVQNAAGDGLQNVANVAFRTSEPVREYFERDQALALHAGSIDRFAAALDLGALTAGLNQRLIPQPGYHEATFVSAEAIATESGDDGVHQRYGLYLPAGRDATRPAPLQLWLHWRGGDAHAAGNVIPSMFSDLGDRHGTIVVSPGGRGSSSWYVGKGHADVMEVWNDVHRRFSIDAARRYVAGHSMGGWGSYLFTVAHPDWFAAGLPASPPATQGGWTGVDFDGCDDLRVDDYSPCYIQANGGDARTQHVGRLLGNLLHVPLALQTGTADELVPVSGVARTHQQLVERGLRNRLYLFHTQEHFGPPVWDQWRDTGHYIHQFTRPERPARVRFTRDMPFERATERELDLDFDRAYWLSGLEPVDERDGVAAFDGRSLALPEKPLLHLPEAWGPLAPGQTGPYTMTGLRWIDRPLALTPVKANAFTATVTGARAATLDTAAMGLDRTKPIIATITTDTPLTLTLTGGGAAKTVTVAPGAQRLSL